MKSSHLSLSFINPSHFVHLTYLSIVSGLFILMSVVGCESSTPAQATEETESVGGAVNSMNEGGEQSGGMGGEQSGGMSGEQSGGMGGEQSGGVGELGGEMGGEPQSQNPPTYLGGDRIANYHLPLNYAPQTPLHLMILLHGYSSSGTYQDVYFKLSQTTREHQILLVTPDGTTNSEELRFWNATDFCCDFEESGVDDLAYIQGLIEEAKTYFQIESVSLIGHSNGGFMAYQFACQTPELIDAVVSLAGTSWANVEDCQQPAPLSVLHIHGTWDAIIRYGGVPPIEQRPNSTAVAQCFGASCGDEYSLCQANEECQMVNMCVSACNEDQPCIDQCTEGITPEANDLWLDFVFCGFNAGCFDTPDVAPAGYASATEMIERWRTNNGCEADHIVAPSLDIDQERSGAETTRHQWTGCLTQKDVELWRLERGSHVPQLNDQFAPLMVQWVLDHVE